MTYFVLAGFMGPMEIGLLVLLVVVLFGGRKIPELMKGMGQGIKEFKKATSEDEDDKDAVKKSED